MPHDKTEISTIIPSPYKSISQSNIIILNISLYPWGANKFLEQYQKLVEHHWYNILDNKHVYLNWLPESEWDGGYHKIPQDHFDIFIFDTLMMDYFISQGWLCAFDRTEISYADEIYPNILSLVKSDNEKYYGIPIYGCFYLIFYRSNDKELSSIKTFDELIDLASKRNFTMRKPSRTLKTLNYFRLINQNQQIDITDEINVNRKLIDDLSRFYKCSKLLLDKTDSHQFSQSSFYVGFTEDINSMIIIDDKDLSQLEFMFLPCHNHRQQQCWLDCIGINPKTKLRSTYEKSLQLANLMTSSILMNEYVKGEFYIIPTNHVTLSNLALNNPIYSKLQHFLANNSFCPSLSLPITADSPILIQKQWSQIMTAIISQHEKDMESIKTDIT